MKITLRKANAIQASINEALKGLEFNSVVSLNEFQKPQEEIKKASEKFAENLKERDNLIGALYSIRRAVSDANNEAGIDSRLADVARLERDISFYSPLAKAQVSVENDVLVGKLGKLKGRQEDAYSRYENEVQTSHFAKETIESFKTRLSTAKKQKQKLQDELLTLNVKTEITLSTETVDVLTKLNVL